MCFNTNLYNLTNHQQQSLQLKIYAFIIFELIKIRRLWHFEMEMVLFLGDSFFSICGDFYDFRRSLRSQFSATRH